MKVLHILGVLNPSGAETMLLCAAPYFQEQDIQGELLSIGDNPGPFAITLEDAGYKIHHIPFAKNLHFFICLYRLLQAQQYDSVHIHSERAGFWLTAVCLLSGIPARRCIRTIHNTFAFIGNLGWRRTWQRQLLNYLGVPHIAISKSVQDTELEYFKINTEIIQNWYDSYRFVKTTDLQHLSARNELKLSESDFVIVSVGNCSLVKNHSALMQAITNLDNKNIVYLHMGIEQDTSEQDLAVNLGISQQIRFLGVQNNILPYLQAADLYVMPSTYEGFGIAAIEAIATEIPVLLSNVPGLKDFSQIFNGLFYCEPTAKSVQEELEKIINTPKNTLRLATANNAQLAEQCFGISRGVSEYITYYKG